MTQIIVLSSSVRKGRKSHRVALYLKGLLESRSDVVVDLLDLKVYDFPLFEERFQFLEEKSDSLLDFTARLKRADGMIIVSPVYNGGYPAALKNVIDLYYREWHHKIVALTSVTDGKVPGVTTLTEIQRLLLKLGAVVSPASVTVTEVDKLLEEDGNATDPVLVEKIFSPMLNDLMWLTEKLSDV